MKIHILFAVSFLCFSTMASEQRTFRQHFIERTHEDAHQKAKAWCKIIQGTPKFENSTFCDSGSCWPFSDSYPARVTYQCTIMISAEQLATEKSISECKENLNREIESLKTARDNFIHYCSKTSFNGACFKNSISPATERKFNNAMVTASVYKSVCESDDINQKEMNEVIFQLMELRKYYVQSVP